MFIISLILAGLVGVTAIMSGSFGVMEARILFSTFAFTVYSIIGLACNAAIGTQYDAIGRIGLGVTACALAFAIFTTWVTPDSPGFLLTRFSFLVVAIGFAHASLMLRIDQKTSAIRMAVLTAIGSSVVVGVLLVAMLHGAGSAGSLQLVGVASVVGVISTLCAPLLSKATG